MFADSTEFGDFLVEVEAGVLVPLDAADAEGGRGGVEAGFVFE